jgi:hypothetical protein
MMEGRQQLLIMRQWSQLSFDDLEYLHEGVDRLFRTKLPLNDPANQLFAGLQFRYLELIDHFKEFHWKVVQSRFNPGVMLADLDEDIVGVGMSVKITEKTEEYFELLWRTSLAEKLYELQEGSLVDDGAIEIVCGSNVTDHAECLDAVLSDQTAPGQL